MSKKNIVEVKNLVKSFPIGGNKFTALNDISVNIAGGEFTGLVGPSGSGKTTLLNIIGGLDTPSEGTVSVLGLSLNGQSHNNLADLRLNRIGFIFQTYNILPVYTVFENVEFPLLLLKRPPHERREKVMQAIEWVGLTDKVKSRPGQLSGGECQRVAIARALVKEPRLVIADEPTANLDAENSHNVMRILSRLNRELKTSFIFATHDEKVMSYLRRILHLVDGRLDKDELIENPAKMGVE
ncbi:MAG: ABC transporter ATP-binding protein [candidate division Zixibacteria bacterium]|nr:ABC transporter ATP-binding protein [candidate division Zixibacteria bacterium]